MRILKTFLLYCGDFLRVLFINIPVNLIMTRRGRWALIALSAPAIALTGLHFWNSAERVFLPAPNQVESIIEEQRLGSEVVFTKDKIMDVNAKIYLSAEEFVRDLRSGEQVLAGYYFEEFKKFDWQKDWQKAEISNLVKVYLSRGENNNSIFFKSYFPDLNGYFVMTQYDKMGLNLAGGAVRDRAIIIWILGGLVWIAVLIVAVTIII